MEGLIIEDWDVFVPQMLVYVVSEENLSEKY